MIQRPAPIAKVAILADPREPEKITAVRKAMNELTKHFESLGTEVETWINVPLAELKPSPDVGLLVVLGGDGTMIHFAARMQHLGIPFYGLNFGNVGFMMNNPDDGLEVHASRIREHTYTIWEFPVLSVRSTDLKGNIHEGVGLNDIYLQRMTPQSCKANIALNHTWLNINPVLCDGIIVSTPLGSTAYSYNVTGSMVAINAQVITMTMVAAQRSCPVNCMMLPMDTTILFEIQEPEKRRVQMVTDGHSHGDLTRAEVRVSERTVKLCFDPEYSRTLPMRFINKACS